MDTKNNAAGVPSYFKLSDGKEVHRDAERGCWLLATASGHAVRWLDQFEADFIDSAFRAAAPASAKPVAPADEREPNEMENLIHAAEFMMKWCVKNVQKWSFAEYDELDRAVTKARAALARQSGAEVPSALDWISVEDELPTKECLAIYVTPAGKRRMIRAKYARQFQIEAEGDDCETEYNDDDDTFYIKAGWLECIDNWGEYSSCYVTEGVVTHWKPLPAMPDQSQAAATAASKEGGA